MRCLSLGGATWLAGVALSLGAAAGEPAPQVRLALTIEEAKLVVDTLGSIACPDVRRLVVCNEAMALLEKIKVQAKEQIR